MSDIIISFLSGWNASLALLKFFIQMVAFCFPLMIAFSFICFIIILLKVFLSKYFDFEESELDEGKDDLDCLDKEDEN